MSVSRWGKTVKEPTMGQNKCDNLRRDSPIPKFLRLDSTGEVTSDKGFMSKSFIKCPKKVTHHTHHPEILSESCLKKLATNLGVGSFIGSANSYLESAATYFGSLSSKQLSATRLTRDSSNSLAYLKTVLSSCSGSSENSAIEATCNLQSMCLEKVDCKCDIVGSEKISTNTCSTWSYKNLFPISSFHCLTNCSAMKMPNTEKYIPPQMRLGFQGNIKCGVSVDPKLTPYNARLLEKSKKNHDNNLKLKSSEISSSANDNIESTCKQEANGCVKKLNSCFMENENCDVDIKVTDIVNQIKKENSDSAKLAEDGEEKKDAFPDWFEYNSDCPAIPVALEFDTELLKLQKKCQTETEEQDTCSTDDSNCKRLGNWFSVENDVEVFSANKETCRTVSSNSSLFNDTREDSDFKSANVKGTAKWNMKVKEKVEEHKVPCDGFTQKKRLEKNSVQEQCDLNKDTSNVPDISAILFVRNCGKKRRRTQKRKREKAQVQGKHSTTLKPGSAVHPRSPVSIRLGLDSGSPSKSSFSFQFICDKSSDSDYDWSSSEDSSDEDFPSLDDDEVLGLRCNNPLTSCEVWTVSCSVQSSTVTDTESVQTSCNSMSRELEAINEAWQLNISIQPESNPHNVDSHKKVHFAAETSLVEVQHINDDDCAYADARKGPWEQYARDRERFSRRIEEVSSVLTPVLLQEHRDRILHKRFNETSSK